MSGTDNKKKSFTCQALIHELQYHHNSIDCDHTQHRSLLGSRLTFLRQIKQVPGQELKKAATIFCSIPPTTTAIRHTN